MKRIGITQRVELVIGYGERRDCLDQAWWQLFGKLGWDLVPVPNSHGDIVGWAQRQRLNGLLLSGGNDISHLPGAFQPAPQRDAVEMALLTWAANCGMPVLGVCRGMQLLNVYLGGSLEPLPGHVACYHSVTACDNSFFEGYSQVNSFHDWGVTLAGLAEDLRPQLQADDGSVEAVKHRSLPWFGMMWHPERINDGATSLDMSALAAIFNHNRQDRA